jgi:hypothetical protein
VATAPVVDEEQAASAKHPNNSPARRSCIERA